MTPSVIDAYLDDLLDDSASPDGAAALAAAHVSAAHVAEAAAAHDPGRQQAARPVAAPGPGQKHEPASLQALLTDLRAAPEARTPANLSAPPVRTAECDLADAVPRTISTNSRWLRMGIGADRYAFELLRVQEVVRTVPILAMRGANVAVLGVMNLRGRIVPVFDLGHWLGTAGVTADERARIVVVERDDELIGVLVSSVEDVVTLGREHIEPPLANGHPGATLGIARTGNAPTVLLDANALFD